MVYLSCWRGVWKRIPVLKPTLKPLTINRLTQRIQLNKKTNKETANEILTQVDHNREVLRILCDLQLQTSTVQASNGELKRHRWNSAWVTENWNLTCKYWQQTRNCRNEETLESINRTQSSQLMKFANKTSYYSLVSMSSKTGADGITWSCMIGWDRNLDWNWRQGFKITVILSRSPFATARYLPSSD